MERYSFIDKEGKEISLYKWIPNEEIEIRGIVQISHGMTETALRYDYFANKLNSCGYIVYANDHRGHGDTAKTKDELGYIADNDGFNWMVEDLKEVTDIIKKENPKLPIILFGHSMGSFLSQRYIELYSNEINGVILSGTNGKPKSITKLGAFIAKCEMIVLGRKHVSKLMDKLSFGDFNKNFKPNRTNYDWLCSVEEEVDKYIKDEKCGFTCTSSFYYDLIVGLWEIHKEENLKSISKELPIHIFSGDKDPVGNFGKGIVNLFDCYLDLGIKNVSYKLYKDGRHEMLNEFKKDIVINDIVIWLNGII